MGLFHLLLLHPSACPSTKLAGSFMSCMVKLHIDFLMQSCTTYNPETVIVENLLEVNTFLPPPVFTNWFGVIGEEDLTWPYL
jgi:hypothetical protein